MTSPTLILGEPVVVEAPRRGTGLALTAVLAGSACAALLLNGRGGLNLTASDPAAAMISQVRAPTSASQAVQPVMAWHSTPSARIWQAAEPAWQPMQTNPVRSGQPFCDIRVRGEGEYGASSTSFYTTAEKQDSYDSLDAVLENKCKDKKLRTLIRELLDACADITEALRSALVTVEGSSNTFGDQQLSVDVIADEILWTAAKNSKVIAYGASEEEPVVKKCNPEGEYTVCWDPLDGSSIVDNNWAVGTMVGVWGSKSGTGADGMLGATGRDQVTSLVALYGPRTTVLVALDDGVYEFSYGCTPDGCQLSDGSFEPWICSRSRITISPECKIFAPANLRATSEVEGYKHLVEHYMENKYTLRYSGGLVPDVYQQFTKQQGVFVNPTSESSPAKLRLAFEAAPFGLLVEKAGGKSSDGLTGGSVLDVTITQVDQRTALCIGSGKEVDRLKDWL
eukprot:gnl/TRDRNA2_/TRDRNA2_176863_c0_seq10.p1 gnl/TRDRNA2_/TRDRNA2_176863_c0~~gnl/TRDRNA2_/TRDRNA2_176863_c0_seq10.p1  ORF type:complete len:452 (-),score=107.35 gnl/TRDRNA2_/TRDRNA2_176863_c0_seq10:283-1638(-)